MSSMPLYWTWAWFALAEVVISLWNSDNSLDIVELYLSLNLTRQRNCPSEYYANAIETSLMNHCDIAGSGGANGSHGNHFVRDHVIGPIFFTERTVKFDSYLDALSLTPNPDDSVIFQQNGASVRYADVVRSPSMRYFKPLESYGLCMLSVFNTYWFLFLVVKQQFQHLNWKIWESVRLLMSLSCAGINYRLDL